MIPMDQDEIRSFVFASTYLDIAAHLIEQAAMRYCLNDVKQELRNIASHLRCTAANLKEMNMEEES